MRPFLLCLLMACTQTPSNNTGGTGDTDTNGDTDTPGDTDAVYDIEAEDCDGRGTTTGTAIDIVAMQVVAIGYSEPVPPRSIITNQTDWEALLVESPNDWTPDFDTQVVYSFPWVQGGCEPDYEYRVWQWGDALRVRAGRQPQTEVCDAYFPQRDLVLVDLDSATDLDWCE